jgi:hypothetical protein
MLFSHLCMALPSIPFSSSFPTKILYAILPSHEHYIVCPSHPPWFHYPNNICWNVLHVMKLLLMQPLPASHAFLPLRSKSPQHSENLCSSLCVRDQVSYPYETGKIMVLCILILKFLQRRWEYRRLWTEW